MGQAEFPEALRGLMDRMGQPGSLPGLDGLVGPGVALFHDDDVVAHAVLAVPAPMVFQHGGTVLMLGRDRGLPVCPDYEPPFPWTGTLHAVVIETGPAIEPSLAERMRALLHSE